ncbi:Outer membrane lipoprotein-sorting protein [Jhaorihella thermophila]|uniref:Outer membrane lipoprotein-sorting protein n=1 Tax=Jhaorihella thermophila TaxID=488547 RepID=A0A1H5XBB6_9RHOB|nr:Outer membrane lipoprotein-sorting protein [Jhaorihella thermophila]
MALSLSVLRAVLTRIVLAIAVLFSASLAGAAEKLPLSDISSYLNGITTAKATFRQVNDDGTISTGRLWLRRPGRMRFEYDPPDSGVVVSRAGAVVIHDPKSNQPPETYPLKRTPLSIILARQVDLGRARMVVAHDFDGQHTIVVAQDPEKPEYGRIEMYFADDPVHLTGWVIHDGNGGRTSVELGELETGMTLSDTLFQSGDGNLFGADR